MGKGIKTKKVARIIKVPATKEPNIRTPAIVPSNIHLTSLKKQLTSSIQVREYGFVNVDEGVVVDPFEHLETNQYLHKCDKTNYVLQAKTCVTQEELSRKDFYKSIPDQLAQKSVQRVLWSPPVVAMRADSQLYADQRGVFSDITGMTIHIRNILSQPVLVTMNSPRAAIQEPFVVQYRDFQRKVSIPAGKRVSHTIHWGDKSNLKCPNFCLMPVEKPVKGKNYLDARLTIETLDFMVEYPSIDRESNSAYSAETEVVEIDVEINYIVNVNYPPSIVRTESPLPILIAGSKVPTLDLFGLKGAKNYVPVKKVASVCDVGDPKWVSLRESTRPFVGLVREGPSHDHKLYLAAMEQGWGNPLPIQLRAYATATMRLWVPGICVSKPIDPQPSSSHAWATVSLFGYSHGDKKWYLWSDNGDSPRSFSDISAFDDKNDLIIVPAGIQGLMLDTEGPGLALELALSDIIGFLDTVTRVLGVVSAAAGMFL